MPTTKNSESLRALFEPRSIAVVGASADPRSFGGFVLGNLERFGYAGALHLVSRSTGDINGRTCLASIEQLPLGIELAVLAIPEAGVLAAIEQLAGRGCSNAVLFASGYAEVGDEGRTKQQALADAAAAGGVRLLGPNCMGFINFAKGVPVTFEPLAASAREARPGISVLAQSGAMAANLRDAFIARGLPVVCAGSTGNEASLTVEDLLAHQLAEPQVRVVALYVEQFRRPAQALALARRARHAGKPLVLLMPGRSQRAREAAASHTGAMASDHASARAALRREAVVLVDTLDELFDTTTLLLRHPQPVAGGTAYLTGSGAQKNLALDFADSIGLALPPLAAATRARLATQLPSYAVAENPLDYTTIGVRQPGLIGDIIHTVLADPGIANAVLSIPVGPVVAQRDKAQHIVPALAAASKPVLLVLGGDDTPLEPFFSEAIVASGVPLFRSNDRALRALARVAAYSQDLQRAARADAMLGSPDETPHLAAAASPALPGPIPPNGIFAEHQGKAWLKALGFLVPAGTLATSLTQAERAAERVGYPVVLKAQASELPHKSDAGGVIVGVKDVAALRQGWARLHDNIAHHRPGLVLDGVLVEGMAAPGLELVLGARRDPDWGVLMLLGLGGVWVEVLKDVRLFPAGLAEADIVRELEQLKAAPLLHGHRGQPAVNLQAVARAAAKLAAAMQAQPRVTEIDLNPLVVRGDELLALDALLVATPDAANASSTLA